MAEEVTRVVEDIDKLFSEIVVNGESHTSDRYIPPKEETTPDSRAVVEENREPVTVTKTVENLDKLFSSIVVNGDEHVSERYVAPSVTTPEEEVTDSQAVAEENREPVTVTKTVENLDKLFSSIVVNGDEHVSERYVAPAVTTPEVSQQNTPTEPPQQTTENVRSTVGADVYAVELNNTLHNFADRVLTQMLANIEALIPNQASPQNQLADKNFVNSSIATNTANFLGTYTSLADIQAIPNPTNNDYAYLETTDQAGNTLYDRYKYSGEDDEWLFEYELNNSSFTAEQWATINSGLTQQSVDEDIQDAIAGIEVNSDYSRQGAYCDTSGSEQAKVAKMVGYALQNGQDFPITFVNANTYAGKITLSINGTTACDVYINNAVSSSSNYTLPAGTYIVHYENSKYYIETAWGVPFARNANVAKSCSGNAASATNAVNATTAGTASNLNGNLIKSLKSWTQLDLSSLNVNYWYPVTFSLTATGSTEVECYVSLDSGTKPSWSTHNGGFTCHLHLLVMGSGWGTTGGQTVVLDKQYGFATADPCGWTQMGNSSTGVLWLRGGGKYRVWNSRNNTFTIRTSTYTVNEESVSPQTANQFSLTRAQMYGNLNGTLTGNVTGNCSGSSGSCTGNSATATTANRVRTSAPSSPVNGDIWVV